MSENLLRKTPRNWTQIYGNYFYCSPVHSFTLIANSFFVVPFCYYLHLCFCYTFHTICLIHCFYRDEKIDNLPGTLGKRCIVCCVHVLDNSVTYYIPTSSINLGSLMRIFDVVLHPTFLLGFPNG